MELTRKVGAGLHTLGLLLGLLLHIHSAHAAHDDLVAQLAKDIRSTIAALHFLAAQSERLAAAYWPRTFRLAARVVAQLAQLMGPDALLFPDRDTLYAQFDVLLAHSEAVVVHPKERDLAVPSLQLELANFAGAVAHMGRRVVSQAEATAATTRTRVNAAVAQLKHIQRLLRHREKLRGEWAKYERKVAKLEKRTSPLSAAEQDDYDGLQTRLKVAGAAFEACNTRLTTVLPQSLLLVEEFVDTLAKWTLCRHADAVEEVVRTFEYFAVFHGYGNESYQEIMDAWEGAATGVRLQVESMFEVIYNKNPDLIDTSVDADDHTLAAAKTWSKMTKPRDRSHKVKPQDLCNGVFNDYLMADPLVSYLKYNDPSLNQYKPYQLRPISPQEVSVSAPEKKVPPPLPPRDETHRLVLLSPNPQGAHLPGLLSPVVPYSGFLSPAAIASPFTPMSNVQLNLSSDSMESVVDSELLLVSDTEDSLVSLPELQTNFTMQRSERELVKLYNSAKNTITEAPVLPLKYADMGDAFKNDIFGHQNSASYKLRTLHAFFDKALEHSKNSPKKVLVAKRLFEGAEPGDLSFKEGDEVEVLFDLQLVCTSYSNDGRNWFVGATGEQQRVGFAPSTYF